MKTYVVEYWVYFTDDFDCQYDEVQANSEEEAIAIVKERRRFARHISISKQK